MKRALLLALFSVIASPLVALDAGDKAPAVEVAKWVVGEGKNPAQPDGNTVYVVEFWATWCGPCRVTIPHLNDMHKRLADKGVVIMGITREDEKTVNTFMKDVPMEYNVGIDKDGATHKTYMKGVQGIPHAFVVGKDGVVAWHGHPAQGLERIVDEVLAGTFDPNKAKKIAEIQDQLRQAKSLDEAMGLIDQLIAADPENPDTYGMKCMVLMQNRQAQAVPQIYAEWAKGCANNPDGLAALALFLVRQNDLGLKNPPLALNVAGRAYKLSQGKNPNVVVALARAAADMAMVDKAIEILEKAKADGMEDPQVLGTLEYFTKLQVEIDKIRKQADEKAANKKGE